MLSDLNLRIQSTKQLKSHEVISKNLKKNGSKYLMRKNQFIKNNAKTQTCSNLYNTFIQKQSKSKQRGNIKQKRQDRFVKTASMNFLHSLNDRWFMKNPSENRLSSQNSQRNSSNDSKRYMRSTCRMFQLDCDISRNKTIKTMSNLLTNIENNKFNQIQHKKEKSFKVLRTYKKIIGSKQNTIYQKENQQRQDNLKIQLKSSKKKRKCSIKGKILQRKSRFSVKVDQKQIKQIKKLEEQSPYSQLSQNILFSLPKHQKFIQLKDIISIGEKQLNEHEFHWLKWKKQQKNTKYSHNTQKLAKDLVNRSIQKDILPMYELQLLEKQKELQRFNLVRKRMSKMKSNQKIIQTLKDKNKQRIQYFFDDLEAKVVQYTKQVNEDKCNISGMDDVRRHLKDQMSKIQLSLIQG